MNDIQSSISNKELDLKASGTIRPQHLTYSNLYMLNSISQELKKSNIITLLSMKNDDLKELCKLLEIDTKATTKAGFIQDIMKA